MLKSTAFSPRLAAQYYPSLGASRVRKLGQPRAGMAPEAAMAPKLLLVGSSIIEQWVDAERQMRPYPVLNLGVSGSTTADWLPKGAPFHGSGLLQRLLLPKLGVHGTDDIVVFYCGSNDVNERLPAATIVSRTQALSEMIWSQQPACKVLYISVMAAPQKARDGLLPVVQEVNELVQKWSHSQSRLTYVDVNAAMAQETAAGARLFVEDELHLTEAGYAVMSRCVLDALRRQGL